MLPSSLFQNHHDTDSGAADCHTTLSAEELGAVGAAAGESNGGRENLGKIQFSIGYNFQEMTLTLKIIRAVELAAKDFTGTSDPYVKVLLLPDKKHKLLTNIKRRNLNPRWNEVFAFEGQLGSFAFEGQLVDMSQAVIDHDRSNNTLFSHGMVYVSIVDGVVDCGGSIVRQVRNLCPAFGSTCFSHIQLI